MFSFEASPFWRFQTFGWIAFVLISFPLKLEIAGSLPLALLLSIVRDGSSFMTTVCLRAIYRKFWSDQIGHMALVIGLSCLLGGVAQTGFFFTLHSALPFRGEVLFTRSIEFNLLYERIGLLFGWSFLYFGIRQLLVSKQREAELANVETQLKATELQLLRAIMNPHFLFNALNFVKTELLETNAYLARVVQAFTNYLRYSLATRHETFVEIGKELDAINEYLVIEKARFGNDIIIECRIDPEVRSVRVPGIIIQPLIENAIKHGRRQLESPPLKIGLILTRNESELCVEVNNNGKWLSPSKFQGSTGIGLESIRERLRLLYGKKQHFEILCDNGQVIVRVRLPSSN